MFRVSVLGFRTPQAGRVDSTLPDSRTTIERSSRMAFTYLPTYHPHRDPNGPMYVISTDFRAECR